MITSFSVSSFPSASPFTPESASSDVSSGKDPLDICARALLGPACTVEAERTEERREVLVGPEVRLVPLSRLLFEEALLRLPLWR